MRILLSFVCGLSLPHFQIWKKFKLPCNKIVFSALVGLYNSLACWSLDCDLTAKSIISLNLDLIKHQTNQRAQIGKRLSFLWLFVWIHLRHEHITALQIWILVRHGKKMTTAYYCWQTVPVHDAQMLDALQGQIIFDRLVQRRIVDAAHG